MDGDVVESLLSSTGNSYSAFRINNNVIWDQNRIEGLLYYLKRGHIFENLQGGERFPQISNIYIFCIYILGYK